MTTPNLSACVYRSFLFYALVFVLTWPFWLVAAYLSYEPAYQWLAIVFALVGLLGPMLAALAMVYFSGSKALAGDCRRRLLLFPAISIRRIFFMTAVVFLSILVATALSLLFGHSVDQFRVSSYFVTLLPLALVAAVCEELGWRTYGVDCLVSGRCILSGSLWFAVLWGVWHVPLFLINQTYQQGLFELGPLYVVNFFVSIFPAAILGNWFYYRCGRSIAAAVFFHFLLVASAELLQTHPQTKCLVTVLLGMLCVALVIVDFSFFTARRCLPGGVY